MPPRVRKLALAVHLTCSIGWIGAVAAYLALDVTVTTSADPQLVRAAWIAMGMVAWSVIVPLAFASFLTGLIMSLGTRWGLIRHWWVVISLALTAFAVVVLMVEAGLIGQTARVAVDPNTSIAELLELPSTLPHSIGGLLVLLVIQVLNIYKPRGLTPYGWRRQRDERRAAPEITPEEQRTPAAG